MKRITIIRFIEKSRKILKKNRLNFYSKEEEKMLLSYFLFALISVACISGETGKYIDK